MQHFQTSIEKHLEEFRVKFPLTKCLQEKDELIYILPTYYNAHRAAQEAVFLIHQLNLPLTVLHGGSASYFVVKSNEYEL